MWDVGGQDKIRPLWRHYYQNTQGLIFVVDSNDRDRVDNARDELHRMLNEDELCKSILLAVREQARPADVDERRRMTDKLGLNGDAPPPVVHPGSARRPTGRARAPTGCRPRSRSAREVSACCGRQCPAFPFPSPLKFTSQCNLVRRRERDPRRASLRRASACSTALGHRCVLPFVFLERYVNQPILPASVLQAAS